MRNAACFSVIKWSNCAQSCLAAVSILIRNFFGTYVIVPIVWHSSVLALGANCSSLLPRELGPRGPKMGLAICLQLKVGEKWLLWPILFCDKSIAAGRTFDRTWEHLKELGTCSATGAVHVSSAFGSS